MACVFVGGIVCVLVFLWVCEYGCVCGWVCVGGLCVPYSVAACLVAEV